MSKKKALPTDAAPEPLAETISETSTTPDEEPVLVVEPDRTEVTLVHRAEASAAEFDRAGDFDPYAAAIQDVLGDTDYVHIGAHHTEFLAVRKLVERGHDEAEAEREVRRRLY